MINNYVLSIMELSVDFLSYSTCYRYVLVSSRRQLSASHQDEVLLSNLLLLGTKGEYLLPCRTTS